MLLLFFTRAIIPMQSIDPYSFIVLLVQKYSNLHIAFISVTVMELYIFNITLYTNIHVHVMYVYVRVRRRSDNVVTLNAYIDCTCAAARSAQILYLTNLDTYVFFTILFKSLIYFHFLSFNSLHNALSSTILFFSDKTSIVYYL